MRSKKLLIALTLCLSLSVIVSAHSGKTDSYGGHIDHSTGEYHYHHGYSAHQHRDLDGDGDLDCPYSFKDKTGSSGNKSESSKNETESTKKSTEKKTVEDYFTTICCLILIFWFLAGLLIDAIKQRKKK